jgi:hypothetical protein
MTDDLEGWELYKTICVDVTNGDIDGIKTQETKFYIKQIDGVWHYKTKKRAKLNKYTTFKSFDGKHHDIDGLIDCGWVDVND